MLEPATSNLESDHFIAHKNGAFYEIFEKESDRIVQTTVSIRLPRKRFGQPIRSKAEAFSAVMGQEIAWLKEH
ncbi:hypothetical protein CMI37_29445 [Candidatus Pacearchaeota archaeon]|nr:hypothetical protein [Candidatus Pacearchaeota archaeon]|tara:strand:+ start:2262 stop:2480 length:219 start_codon:yes stop_codon:yes gene_type:complete